MSPTSPLPPKEYRWCSLGYHSQTNNRDKFLSMDFGLEGFGLKDTKARLAHYRRFVYEKGGILEPVEDRSQGSNSRFPLKSLEIGYLEIFFS